MKNIIFILMLISNILICPTRSRGRVRVPKWWHEVLQACVKYSLPFDKISATVMAESHGKKHCREWRRGRIISYGRMQVSLETIDEYRKANGTKHAIDPYDYSVEVACWQIARYQRWLGGDIGKSLSAHNLGYEGYLKYRRSSGRKYYSRYINLVNKYLRRKIK